MVVFMINNHKPNDYFIRLSDLARLISTEQLESAVELLYSTWNRGRFIFTAGNGGSCSTAQHMALDLSKACRWTNLPVVKSTCLISSAEITAWSNDEHYDMAILRSLEGRYILGDLFVAFSCSGTSANIVKALEFVRSIGGPSILMTGNNPRARSDLATIVIAVPDDDIRKQEDMHLAISHYLTMRLRELISHGRE
jgi:D-sedoheptulose 7-phosphate isomerase